MVHVIRVLNVAHVKNVVTLDSKPLDFVFFWVPESHPGIFQRLVRSKVP